MDQPFLKQGQNMGSTTEQLPWIVLLLGKCVGFICASREIFPFSPGLLVKVKFVSTW